MKVNFDTYEEYLFERYGEWADGQSLFMKLVEEMGEIAEVLNCKSGRKSAGDKDLDAELGAELADAIHYIIAIAAVNNIDLNKTIIEKDKLGSVKYGHKINLEDFIKKKGNSV